ncbi:MAG: uroporphyrinogen-III C-methyltransferase [Coriobacteriales bacterium]|jgi:uroporphyrinogen III methyltransferase/synthase|nr:uroporphyrinogen-III C-methyltransferase [Coriobacteriales bacterium]
MNEVTVYLIGAGPGDPELITVKGRRVIEEADVIIYDYLSNPALLDYARGDAKKIYVGKKGFSKHITQDEINQCLLDEAKELQSAGGGIIARLKGGDPFVFGRGGEEAIVLAQYGVPFEIVPGVTAGVAAPAYAGIPVTHRGLSSSVAFITGNEDPRKEESSIDWAGIANGAETLCFYMGIRNLPRICSQLVAHGRDAATPVALVRWGTMPNQEVLCGTLDDIAGKAAEADFKSPAIILVGQVASLRESIAWLEHKPLCGMRIAVTRTQAQAGVLGRKLEALGASVVLMPTIEIHPIEPNDALKACTDMLDAYDWLVFTSANGVRCFFDHLRRFWPSTRHIDARALAGIRIAAIGPATAAALGEYGIHADVVPPRYVAESAVEAMKDAGVRSGDNVLLPRASEARDALPNGLRDAGAHVDVVPVYKTLPSCSGTTLRALDQLKSHEIDAITFTASSTAKNFFALLEENDIDKNVLDSVLAYSIGPITTSSLEDFGFAPKAQAVEYTIDGLVKAIEKDRKHIASFPRRRESPATGIANAEDSRFHGNDG